jgi:hypothetical protein
MDTAKIYAVYLITIKKGAFQGRMDELIRLLEMLELHGSLEPRESEELLHIAWKMELERSNPSAHSKASTIPLSLLSAGEETPRPRRSFASRFSFLRPNRSS